MIPIKRATLILQECGDNEVIDSIKFGGVIANNTFYGKSLSWCTKLEPNECIIISVYDLTFVGDRIDPKQLSFGGTIYEYRYKTCWNWHRRDCNIDIVIPLSYHSGPFAEMMISYSAFIR